jgi:glycosyltransferase involved in cell wall biosynthesis
MLPGCAKHGQACAAVSTSLHSRLSFMDTPISCVLCAAGHRSPRFVKNNSTWHEICTIGQWAAAQTARKGMIEFFMSIRLLGLQIANGYSPEARVFAGLLAHTDSQSVEMQVLHQASRTEDEALLRFRAASQVSVQPMDFGWRSMAQGRSLSDKAKGQIQFLASLPKALAQARRFQPDVIYSCQQLWDCRAATYIARKLGRPQIIHLHYIIGPWLHRPILERLRTCDHILTVSDFIREEALRHGVAPEKVTTIRNTMVAAPSLTPGAEPSVRQELGIAADAPLLGIVARLDPEKGQSDTLRAFASLRKKYPAARLLVVGDETAWHPGYAEQLKQEAAQLRLGDSALFLGRRSDVPRLLNALDLFVHPSRKDPCPLALLEASAAEVPVIAYAEGGAQEIVAHGLTGLLSEPGSVSGLAASMNTLLCDPAQARAMGKAGRARTVSDFQPAQAGLRFTSLLESVAHRA